MSKVINKSLRKQTGQAMAEYIVVCAGILGVYHLTYLDDAVAELNTAIQNKNAAYAYAVSLSDYPVYTDLDDLVSEYERRGMEVNEALTFVNDTQSFINSFNDFLSGELPDELDPESIFDISIDDLIDEFSPI